MINLILVDIGESYAYFLWEFGTDRGTRLVGYAYPLLIDDEIELEGSLKVRLVKHRDDFVAIIGLREGVDVLVKVCISESEESLAFGVVICEEDADDILSFQKEFGREIEMGILTEIGVIVLVGNLLRIGCDHFDISGAIEIKEEILVTSGFVFEFE